MKEIPNDRILENNTPFKSYNFGIKSKNLGHIITLLRDQIYSDKILAVIREYSCNAYDANVMSGRKEVPIVVTLPTRLDPMFKVRDYGAGLSESEIEDIFISYGESTKRNTNDAVGFLGIGAKCGFAYGSNFLVTSFNNGTKTVYDCVLDKSNVGNCLVLTSEPMADGEKDGIEISLPVKMEDINYFVQKAVSFYKHWNVKPTLINCKDEMERETKDVTVLFEGKDGDWAITTKANNRDYRYNDSHTSVALMGNIPYPIQWDNVRMKDDASTAIVSVIKNNNILIKFGIGELEFAPSREALQYTEHTNTSLIKMVVKIVKEIEAVVQKRFEDCKSLLEALTLYNDVFDDYYAPLHTLTGKINVQWNKLPITGSSIDGVHNLDAVKGWSETPYSDGAHLLDWVPVMKCFEKQARHGNIRESKGGRYNCRKIECRSGSKILLFDGDKIHHIRKTVKYLFSQDNNLKRVYSFKFQTTKAMKETYDHLFLEHLNVTKYSDIKDEVKKSVVHVSSTGNAIKLNTSEISVKTFSVVSNPVNYYYSRSQLTSDVIDTKTGNGYYFKIPSVGRVTIKTTEMDIASGLQNVNRIVYLANSLLGKSITSVYGFGPRVYDNKKVDISKFVCIDDLLKKISDFIDADDQYKFVMAFNSVIDDNSAYSGYFGVIKALVKSNDITDGTNTFYKLNKVFTDNKIETHDSCSSNKPRGRVCLVINALSPLIGKSVDYKKESKEISDMYKTVETKYPMIYMLVKSNGSYWSMESKTTKMFTDYINMVDGI